MKLILSDLYRTYKQSFLVSTVIALNLSLFCIFFFAKTLFEPSIFGFLLFLGIVLLNVILWGLEFYNSHSNNYSKRIFQESLKTQWKYSGKSRRTYQKHFLSAPHMMKFGGNPEKIYIKTLLTGLSRIKRY